MEIAQEKRGAVSVLAPVGRLDTDSAADLELAVHDQLSAGAKHYVVDLARINYVSSAGLRVLLMLAKSVDGKGSLRVCGLNPQVQQVFDIAGFTKLFALFPDRDTALRDHPTGPTELVVPPPAAEKPARAPREAAPAASEAKPAAPAPAEAPVESAARAPRESAPAPAVAVAVPAPVAAPSAPREPAPLTPAEPAPAREPREAPPTAPPPVAVAPPAAPPPPAEPPQPSLAELAARLLGARPASTAPIDADAKSLARHAAMLLGAALEAGAPAAARAAGAGAPKPGARTPAPPAPEPEEKGGFLSRLLGKKKRTPGI